MDETGRRLTADGISRRCETPGCPEVIVDRRGRRRFCPGCARSRRSQQQAEWVERVRRAVALYRPEMARTGG